MMPRGAFSELSDSAAMLAAAAPDGVLGAGRGCDELLDEELRLGGQAADTAERMESPRAVCGDLALELLARAELVEDLADAFDAGRLERRGWREQRGELGLGPRRRLLEGHDHRQRLLALHEVLHLELAGALGRRPDPEEVVVRLEGLLESVTEPGQRLADLHAVRRDE